MRWRYGRGTRDCWLLRQCELLEEAMRRAAAGKLLAKVDRLHAAGIPPISVYRAYGCIGFIALQSEDAVLNPG